MVSRSARVGETRIGGYRLLAPIGEGGMGVVHLAQGEDGHRVALKVLRPHIVGDAEARERLAREVGSLRRIKSPRIAEILDADPHGPVPFVVTRYVPGLSLYHHVAEEGPVTGADLVHFADALTEALLAVHSAGVLHRDIKPTNVLMEGRSPVLIDFGLARVAEDPRLTRTGWLLGTPGHLAPEILYGDDASVASDVHAWAATVVVAATGRPPYGTGPAMAIMDRVRRGEHDLSGVPEPFDRLLRDALSPEPLERPSVHELRAWVGDLRRRTSLVQVPAETEAVPVSDADAAPWTIPYSPVRDVPVREATPYQQPAPPTRMLPVPQPALPPNGRPDSRPHNRPPVQPATRSLRLLMLLGLGAVTSAVVASAPYAGTALVAILVLVLRTTSVTRQRHGRRRTIRGRPRWFDVPTTTLSLPGYLLLALFGTVLAVGAACCTAVVMFAIGYLLGQPVEIMMLLAGLGFTPMLWWGPGSGRVREMTRGAVMRTARSEFGGWLVVALCALGTAVLVTLLLGSGPSWAPAVSAPWTRS